MKKSSSKSASRIPSKAKSSQPSIPRTSTYVLKAKKPKLGFTDRFKFWQTPVFTDAGAIGSLQIRQLVRQQRPKDPGHIFTLIVLGETGHGKSTLLNALSNYLFDVKVEDPFRYRLVDESVGARSQTVSQTTEVIDYWIPLDPDQNAGMNIWLQLIDTPGFADTRGIEADETNTKLIYDFLKTQEDVHGVCFVSNGTISRLTPKQKYVIHKIQTLFAKDAKDNIFLLATFCDDKKPPVVKAVEETKFPYKTCFQFNNSALFTPEEERGMLTSIYWQICEKGAEAFFQDLERTEPFSLRLTKQVIEQRKRIQEELFTLRQNLEVEMQKIAAIEKQKKRIRENKDAINESRDFEYYEPVDDYIKHDLPSGRNTTHCQKCNHTCHHSCAYSDNRDKERCSSMSNGRCTVCPNKCEWQIHWNQPFWIEKITKQVKKVLTAKKKKFEEAKSDITFSEEILATLQTDYDKARSTIVKATKNAQAALNKLHEIALLDINYSYSAYLKLLIKSEEDEKKEGFEDRIDLLKGLLQEALQLEKIKKERGP